MTNNTNFEAFAPTLSAAAKLGYQLCLNQDPDKNVVLSPIGILSMMIVLHAGAAGKTRQQLGQFLGLTQNDKAINNLSSLLKELESRSRLTEREEVFLNQMQIARESLFAEGAEQKEIEREIFYMMRENPQMIDLKSQEDLKINLSAANSVWVQRSFACKQPYIDLIQNKLGAHLEMVDFEKNREQACDKINDWIKKSTQNLVNTILSPDMLNALTKVVLTNTFYFTGLWKETFNYPRPGQFHLFNGQVKEVQTISNSKELRYFENNKVRFVLLPYRHRPIYMALILPKKSGKKALVEVEKMLGNEGHQSMLDHAEAYSVDITMPEFKFNFEANLFDTLDDLKEIVSDGDFSEISEAVGFSVDKLLHQSMIEVNQHGTKAFAYSHGEFIWGIHPKHTLLKIDRPFLFLILDEPTNTVLFMGRVANPI